MIKSQYLKAVFLAAASLSIIAGGSAHASNQEGTVYWYASDTNTTPYAFTLNGTRTTKPACATDDAWAITSPTTDGSKALLAGIMTAQINNRRVSVVGSGTCDPTSPLRERVQYILFF